MSLDRWLRPTAGIAVDGQQRIELLLEFVDLAPVSYTHLRAHETVLDLVCRLLLEKKKHTHDLTHVCCIMDLCSVSHQVLLLSKTVYRNTDRVLLDSH